MSNDYRTTRAYFRDESQSCSPLRRVIVDKNTTGTTVPPNQIVAHFSPNGGR